MKPYIFGSRGDIYIIDLKETLYGLDAAYTAVSKVAEKGGTVLFVGTKKQAQEPIAEAANRCGMPYVNARWLGGMLTNFVTNPAHVFSAWKSLRQWKPTVVWRSSLKKEQILLKKELAEASDQSYGLSAT